MINIVSSSRYKVNKKDLKKRIEKIVLDLGINLGQTINIVFVGKNKMRSLANTYKKEDVALPVLSFPFKDQMIDNEPILGEVFLCYPQVVLLAAERNKKVSDMILQLIEHGVENLIK